MLFFYSCKDTAVIQRSEPADQKVVEERLQIEENLLKEKEIAQKKKDLEERYRIKIAGLDTISDSDFVNIEEYSGDFMLDMKYATPDNFLKEAVYDCAKCYIRVPVAKALLKANDTLMKLGYRLRFFDCYRPYSVQKKMWKIFPNPGYVADPKGGSIHNKGAAVDISLVTLDGSSIDMGTEFDFFGKEAHHSYTKLSAEVLAHRKLLKTIMENHGFKTIRTEWWHYNFTAGRKFRISDFRWECE
ncbi:M15 family metallopeptidase [Aquimarina addita]|uniref:D-alanyl-D-alanine dipeptidase n=2 Tax=Aquimarina addita TaxID=870485 RepID=A0ABP6UK02_9FLAO